ncbi:hypothetical protein SALBM311S_00784 [Streptomyces alboniger]
MCPTVVAMTAEDGVLGAVSPLDQIAGSAPGTPRPPFCSVFRRGLTTDRRDAAGAEASSSTGKDTFGSAQRGADDDVRRAVPQPAVGRGDPQDPVAAGSSGAGQSSCGQAPLQAPRATESGWEDRTAPGPSRGGISSVRPYIRDPVGTCSKIQEAQLSDRLSAAGGGSSDSSTGRPTTSAAGPLRLRRPRAHLVPNAAIWVGEFGTASAAEPDLDLVHAHRAVAPQTAARSSCR